MYVPTDGEPDDGMDAYKKLPERTRMYLKQVIDHAKEQAMVLLKDIDERRAVDEFQFSCFSLIWSNSSERITYYMNNLLHE